MPTRRLRPVVTANRLRLSLFSHDRIQDSRNILRLAKLVSLPTPNTPVCMRPRYSALGSLARSAPHRAQSPVPHSWLAAVQARSGCPNRTHPQLQACRSLIWYRPDSGPPEVQRAVLVFQLLQLLRVSAFHTAVLRLPPG